MKQVKDRLNQLLKTFSKETGQAVLPIDDSNFTEFKTAGVRVRINFLNEAGVILVLVPIVRTPDNGLETFYRRLLEASFLSTGEIGFAIDKESDIVYLRAVRRIKHLHYSDFKKLLKHTTELGSKWRRPTSTVAASRLI